jgi:hypothetical protein
LMAVFVAAVAVASTASAALPKVLPETGVAREWTGKSEGVVELKGPTSVECTEAPATGTQEANKPLGLFHIEFKNCSSIGVKCTGLGDATGTILTLGTWHSVFDLLTTLTAGLVFLIEKVHFNCSALVLVLVSGELVCLWLKAEESNVTHSFHCKATSSTVQEDEKYFNEAGTEVKTKLSCSVNEAAKEEPCTELALGSQTFKEAVSMDI